MRKFTTLFLLALAMTIGANQAFAQQAGGPGSNGTQGRAESDNNPNDNENDGDPGAAPARLLVITRVPPRHIPKPPVIEKDSEDCSCQQKVIRVGARFVTVRDCYQSIQVNGKERLHYCSQN